MSEESSGWEEPEILEGRYANCFKVGHNAFEFIVDFGQMSSENDRVQLHTRVITHPRAAKVLWNTLGESLETYESSFGIIRDDRET